MQKFGLTIVAVSPHHLEPKIGEILEIYGIYFMLLIIRLLCAISVCVNYKLLPIMNCH